MDDRLERVVDVVGRIARTALIPWGGAEACLDLCETAIRSVTEAQLTAAQVIAVDPARAIVATTANMTRDIGAAQLSAARWILDV
jgi:uncharacterized protein YcfJ